MSEKREPKVFYGFYMPKKLSDRLEEYWKKKYGMENSDRYWFGVKSYTMVRALEKFLDEEESKKEVI